MRQKNSNRAYFEKKLNQANADKLQKTKYIYTNFVDYIIFLDYLYILAMRTI